MSDYYRQNLDKLYGYDSNNYNGTARNCVLEVTFSDTQSSNPGSGGLLTETYTAAGGETDFIETNLIGAIVVSLTRDGLTYTQVEDFSPTLKKEFQFDIATGEITFATGLPAMEQNEDVTIIYIAAGYTPVDITEPVTLAEARAWLKVDVTDDDVLIEALITAARQACEGYVNLSFVTRTVTACLRNDLGNIRLPYGPVNAITSMADVDGNEADYTVTGETVKQITSPRSCYLKAVYTAGYAVLPKQFKTAVLMELTWMYQHRGDGTDLTQLSTEAKMILKQYRSVV